MICKHCEHDTDDAVTRSVAVDQPGRPVSAICTLFGCQYGNLMDITLTEDEWNEALDLAKAKGVDLPELIGMGLRLLMQQDEVSKSAAEPTTEPPSD